MHAQSISQGTGASTSVHVFTDCSFVKVLENLADIRDVRYRCSLLDLTLLNGFRVGALLTRRHWFDVKAHWSEDDISSPIAPYALHRTVSA